MARYLAETRKFAGTVYFIFRPAEEVLGGAKARVDEVLFDKFPVQAVFGMHNRPGLPVGRFAIPARTSTRHNSRHHVIAFAGVVRGRRTRVARALTCDLPVPADAEIVLEGEVAPGERRLEGPFGDHFGHYSAAADFPVFRVRAMTHRPGAVYPAAVVGKPPQEDRYMGDATQAIVGPLIRLMRPEVRSLWAYYEAGFHNLLVAALEGRYTRAPVRTALGILGEGQLGLSKCLILVGAGVDVRCFPAVLRAIRDHFDPREHVIVIPRAPLDTLDFTSFEMHRGSRMIIDATGNRADYSGGGAAAFRGGTAAARSDGGAAEEAALGGDPRELAPHVRRWRLWEDTLLLVQVDRVPPAQARATLETLVGSPALSGVKMVAAVSPDVDIDDDVEAIWGVFTRFDPARDLVFTRARLEGAHPVFEGVMGIDATWKPGYPEPLEMSDDVVRKVDRRWQDYWK